GYLKSIVPEKEARMRKIARKTVVPFIFIVALLLLVNPHTGLADQGTEDNREKVEDNFMSHKQLGEKLYQMEEDSSGKVQVDVIGNSQQGREIYTARVGTGDQVLLVNGNIHGNEKSGPEALMQMFETLGTSDSP